MTRFRSCLLAAPALGLLLAGPAAAADVKPLVNVSGAVRPVHAGETVGADHGGTGAATLTAHCVIIGFGTAAVHLACPTSSGYVLTDNGASADPSFQAAAGGGPGGSSGQIQYNNASAFGGFTMGGDCTFSVPNVTCTKTGGVSFTYFATGTDGANLTGTISVNRFNGGSGASVTTFLRGDGTWAAAGAGTVTSIATSGLVTGGPITGTGTISLSNIGAGHVVANATSGSAAPADTTVTSLLDQAISSTQGGLLERGAATWGALAAGTNGYVLTSNGAGTDPTYQAVGAVALPGHVKAAAAAVFMLNFGGL